MERIILENDLLKCELDPASGAFISIFNKHSQLELIPSPQPALASWELEVGIRDGSGERIEKLSRPGAFSFTRASSAAGTPAFLRLNVSDGLSISVRAEFREADGALLLWPEVESSRSDAMIVSLRYPILRGIGRLSSEPERNLLAHPLASGFLFKDPYSLFQSGGPRGLDGCKYPNGFDAPSQFMVYYADGVGGFYLGCEDPYGTVKDIDFYSPEGQGYLEVAFGHYSWEMHFGNSLMLGYPVVIGALKEGSWEEGAELYRNWATGTGPGHPDWCKGGRLEERVARGEAAKWLSEEVGFCTFGMPSSIDVSKWVEAFHKLTGAPVFHVFGLDWPHWAADPLEQGRLDATSRRLGLGPLGDIALSSFKDALAAAQGLPQAEAVRAFVHTLCRSLSIDPPKPLDLDSAQPLFDGVRSLLDQWLAEPGMPQQWFPTIFHRRNVEALQRLGDHYALFEFDFLAYGNDFEKHGLNTRRPGLLSFSPQKGNEVGAKWMDPGADFWKEFHGQRDAQASRETGSDADYYDISSAAVIRSLFSNRTDRLERPMGWGRKLVEEYRDIYDLTKEATRAATGKYIPQGSEVLAEVYMAELDYAQCRAGGGVQGDMEGIRFLEWMKQGSCWRIPLFSYVYHEYGMVKLDGWAKLSREFGDIFYLIAAQVALEGGILELNYEFSPLELLPGTTPPSYQLRCRIPTHPGPVGLPHRVQIHPDEHPLQADEEKLTFLRELAAARTGFAKDFLAYGKMIRPARLASDIPTVALDWRHYNSLTNRREKGVVQVPAVVHHGWSYKGEELGYIFCNVTRALQHVEPALDLGGTPLEGRPVEVFQVDAEGRRSRGGIGRTPKRVRIALPPRRIVLLELVATSSETASTLPNLS